MGPLGGLPAGGRKRGKTPVDYVNSMDLGGSPPGTGAGAFFKFFFKVYTSIRPNVMRRPRRLPFDSSAPTEQRAE